MDKLFFCGLLVALTVNAFAQDKMYNTDELLKSYGEPDWNKLKKINDNKRNALISNLFAGADTARYLSGSSQGYVYALPNSNMPCLKPTDDVHKSNRLSGGNNKPLSGQPGIIPNGLHRRPLVFETPPASASTQNDTEEVIQ